MSRRHARVAEEEVEPGVKQAATDGSLLPLTPRPIPGACAPGPAARALLTTTPTGSNGVCSRTPAALDLKAAKVPRNLVFTDAGWSSSVARWAHNPEVTGSNPVPATNAVPSQGQVLLRETWP